MELADLLQSHVERLGLTTGGLHRRLIDLGCDRKERAVYQWFAGGGIAQESLAPLADALELTPEQRVELARAAGYGDVLDLVQSVS